MHGLQGALLRAKLPHLDAWNEARRAHARRYREALPDGLEPLRERDHARCVYHLFPVRHPERDRLARELAAEGIQTKVHYTPAAHSQPAFASLPAAARPASLSHSDAWAASELSLPMFPELAEAELDRVAEALRTICG